jgi:hypothetical protein
VTARDHPGWQPATLRAAREAAGYTQEGLADAISQLQLPDFTPPRASAQAIRRHETGRSWPSPAYRHAYRHVLHRTDAELGFRPAAQQTTPGVAWPHSPAELPPSGHEEEATNRRDLIGIAGVAVGVTTLGLPALTTTDRLAMLERTTAGQGAVSMAENALQTIVADYLYQPPPVILRRVAALQQLTDGITHEYPLRPADQTRLWRVAGIAAGMRAWLQNNAGSTEAARLSLREAHRRGELLDDPQLIAWTRYMQATIEDYAGNTEPAEHYALDGLQHTAPNTPQRALFLGDVVAKVRATRGDVNAVHQAIDEASDILSGLSLEQRGPTTGRMIVHAMTTFSPLCFARAAGCAYGRLGRPDRFNDVTTDGRLTAERTGTPHRALFRMDQALATIRSAEPDLERTAELTREGLDLADPFQTAHVTSRLDAVIEAAQPFHSTPVIRELNDYSRMWRAERRALPTPSTA